jgi:hypothetical protein
MSKLTKKVSIWGVRRARMRPPSEILQEADHEMELLFARKPSFHNSLALLRDEFMTVSRSYFSLAAMTRRVDLNNDVRETSMSRLFRMRSTLEKALLDELRFNAEPLSVLSNATNVSFLGKSKKQGVSIRYALASCVPTSSCGGRCYAHDGRDRELLHIYRGVLNYYVGIEYENGDSERRSMILKLLAKSIDSGVLAALEDQREAASSGYKRFPRIRFSHVGEMAATPDFTNALAGEVKRRDPRVQCVIYTRHPKAHLLDTELLVVNFTLEGAGDVRKKFVPSGSRIVNSAWDGEVYEGAEVNFLEHHVEKSSASNGKGSICPVTANHKQAPSCDLARCQKCFVPIKCN